MGLTDKPAPRGPLAPRSLPLSQLSRQLQPYFLSSSYGQPPGASLTQTGGRTIALTNRQGSSRPQDATTLTLVAGVLTWDFTTKFISPPSVTPTPVGAPPSGAILYISALSNTSVTITSTVNTDTRVVHLLAIGNPN